LNTQERMQQGLAALAPECLDIQDESAAHAGHAGAQGGGGHYSLMIVSPQFAGKLTVARHRMIYDALKDLMQKEIHALSIQAYSPDEV
jgi:BolA family transcriptional regulator, general stress-responsive regulator